MNMATQTRGKVTVDQEECKGCGVCVDACPPKCLALSAELNAYGVHAARYKDEGCTACGICFYVCPEPGAITVYRMIASPRAVISGAEENHAAAL
jgi:Pyruvate/2-oxoacid:ferredoxin oxidoreductase delta subunit